MSSCVGVSSANATRGGSTLRPNAKRQLKEETLFHDAIYGRTQVDEFLVERLLGYTTPAGSFGERLPRLKYRVLDALGDVRHRRVLVYGCGDDCAALWFSKYGANVDAIDVSAKSIEIQKKLAAIARLTVNAIVMDGNDLDLPSHEYDFVYGNAILHHLRLSEAVPEIHRVLKPTGIAVFRDVMQGSLFVQIFRYLTPFLRTKDEHPLTPEDLILLSNSFNRCEIDHYIFSGQPYRFLVQNVNPVLKKMKLSRRIPHSNAIYAKFDKLDCVLFRVMPFLRRQAWLYY